MVKRGEKMSYSNNTIKRSIGEQIFNICNIIFMILMILVMFYPMWHVVCASFSDARLLSAHSGMLLWPKGYSGICNKSF